MGLAQSLRGNRSSLPRDDMAAALPKGEFFKFAKMMGLDLSDSSLGPEAEEIWNKLNHMSENDPIAYSNFIAAQKEQAVEDKQQAPPARERRSSSSSSSGLRLVSL